MDVQTSQHPWTAQQSTSRQNKEHQRSVTELAWKIMV
jgi:hypothetical protein